MPTTVVSWNIAKSHEPWRQLLQMGADIALLQEAGPVPPDVAGEVDTAPWSIGTRTFGIRVGTKAVSKICTTGGRWL